MYDYVAFLQEGPFELLFSSWKPWAIVPVLIITLYVLFMRSRKKEGIE